MPQKDPKEDTLMLWRSADVRIFTPAEYRDALAMLDPVKRERVERIRQRKDKMRTVFGDLLARQLLSEVLKVSPEKLSFAYADTGKPYLENGSYHFSISHSEDMVAVCVHEEPCGIDIEKIREVDPKLALRFFSAAEQLYLFRHEPKDSDLERPLTPDAQLRFFEVWTAKEAYLKCSGEGMTHVKTIDTTPLSFERHLLPDGYIVTIFK